MSQPNDQGPQARLSSMMDGHATRGEVAEACSSWKSDESVRRSWHAYQLIGDVLRSDDLAAEPAHDCDFLAKLRVRLEAEPVVLAPQRELADEAAVEPAAVAVAAIGGRRPGASFANARRWKVPMSVAASVLAVTGVLAVARVSGLLSTDSAPAGLVAQQGSPSQANSAVGGPSVVAMAPARSGLQTVSAQSGGAADNPVSLSAVQPQTLVANGKLIRDARLDQYLAAHKQFGGSTALGVPSGFLRSATSESRDR